MLRTTLWIAAGCVVLLAVLALSRGLKPGGEAERPAPARMEIEAAPRPAEPRAQPVAPPPATPEDMQMQDDAAAVGMTTMEPEPAPEATQPAQ